MFLLVFASESFCADISRGYHIDLDRIFSATLNELTTTEGCQAVSTQSDWGMKTSMSVEKQQFVSNILAHLNSAIRCK